MTYLTPPALPLGPDETMIRVKSQRVQQIKYGLACESVLEIFVLLTVIQIGRQCGELTGLEIHLTFAFHTFAEYNTVLKWLFCRLIF